MNKLKKYFTMIFFMSFIYLLFKYNHIVNSSVISATSMFLNKVFPSLFIMFVLNDIIINTRILHDIFMIFSSLFNKIFHTSGLAIEAFALSLLSGTPSSVIIIKELLKNNDITSDDANKLITFTYFSNPLFLYNILTATFNTYTTIKIILIHYITNIFIGIIFRGNKPTNMTKINKQKYKQNIFIILPDSIKKSMNTLLVILGTITFYLIISNITIHFINSNNFYTIIFKGVLEITQALNELKYINYLSIIKEITALAIISFGGLSIHTQVLTIIDDTNISYKNFLIGRILHVILATQTYFLFYYCSLYIN